MAGGAVIGALRVVLGADTAEFEDGLKKAEGKLGSFGSSIGKAAEAIGVAMAGAVVTLGVGIARTINQMDSMGKSAQKMGLPVDELSRLKYAADLSDVAVESLAKAVGILSKNMNATAGNAVTPAASAFQALGISVTDTGGKLKSANQVMGEVAEKFAGMQDGAGKTALAMAIFGKSGAEMIPLLNSGSKGLADMAREAAEFGIVIDSKTNKSAEAFNDNLKRLGIAKDGVFIILTSKLLPALERLSNDLVQAVKDSNLVRITADALARTIGFVYDNVAVLAQGLGILIGLKVISTLVGFATAFIALTQAIIAAGVATTLLNAAKTLTIAKVAAFGAIILWATGNLPAFTDALKTMGDAIAQILPQDTGATIMKGLQSLGINVSSLTGDLKGLGDAAADADSKMPKKPSPGFSPEAAANAKKLREETEKLALQTAVLQHQFDFLAPGFVLAAQQMEMFSKKTAASVTSVTQLSPQLQALNAAMLQFQGAQMTQENLNVWEKYEEQLKRIQQLLDAGAISQETFGRATKAAAADSLSMMQNAASETATALTNIFKDNKAASIAAAIINTAVAVTKALSSYPPPLSFAMAGLQAAAGAVQIATIKSSKMATGGAFTMPGGVGGTKEMAIPATAFAGERVTVERPPPGGMSAGIGRSVTIAGLDPRKLFSGDMVRTLFETVNQGLRDGHKLDLKFA